VLAIKAWKIVTYQTRVVKYFRGIFLEKHGRVFFDHLRERYFEIRTERALARKASAHLLAVTAAKVFTSLARVVAKQRAARRVERMLKVGSA
jgi:hypothetical protein